MGVKAEFWHRMAYKEPPCTECPNESQCAAAGLACWDFAGYAQSRGGLSLKLRKTPRSPSRAIYNKIYQDEEIV